MTDTSDKRTKDIRYDPATWKHGWAASAIIRDLFAKLDEQKALLGKTKGIHNVLDVQRIAELEARLTEKGWTKVLEQSKRIAELRKERDEANEHVESEQAQAVKDAIEHTKTIRENMQLRAALQELWDLQPAPALREPWWVAVGKLLKQENEAR